MLDHTAYQAAAVALPPRAQENPMTALYRAAVGPIHADRYLPIFERLDAAGRALPRWNWAAALSTLNWMVFRRLWGAALVYVAALEAMGLLGFAIGRQVLQLPLPIFSGLALAFVLIACAVPGLYGDAIFHADVRKRITKALSASATLPQAADLLAKQAPRWRRLGWIAAANGVLAAAMAAAYLLLPSGNPFADDTLAPPPATQPVTEARAPSPQTAASAPAAPASSTASAPLSSASDAAETRSQSTPLAALPASAAASSAASAAVAPSATSVPTTTPPTVVASNAATAPPTAIGADKPPVAPASTPPTAPRPVPAPVAKAEGGNATTPPSAASAPAPTAAPATSTTRVPTAAAPKPAPAPRAVRPAAPAAKPAAKPASAASAAASAASTPAVRRLYINVGLFADPANARRAHARLQEAGLPATSDPVTFNSGKRLTRVRVGPFASSSEANAATERVRAMGLDAAAHQQ